MAALKLRRTIFLCFSYLLAIFTGLSDINTGSLLIQFFLPWLVAFSLVIACSTDARIVGKSVPNIVQFLMLFTWPLSIPLCLFWTRRWWGLMWVLVFGATLLLTVYLTAMFLFYYMATR